MYSYSTVYILIYIKEEKRNEEYRVQVLRKLKLLTFYFLRDFKTL